MELEPYDWFVIFLFIIIFILIGYFSYFSI